MYAQSNIGFGDLLASLNGFISLKAFRTQQAYRQALEMLAGFMSVKVESYAFEKALVQFTPLQASRFTTWMKHRRMKNGQRYADASVALRLAVLQSTFRHLTDLGVRAGNPFALLRGSIPLRQRVQKRPTKLIPFDAVQRILDAPERKGKEGIRDRALLGILFGGGLRRSEALKLNMNDIGQTTDGVPFLILRATKGGQNQQQSLPKWAWVRLLMYLEQRDQDGATHSDPLFVFYYKNGAVRGRLSDSSIIRIFRKHTHKAGIAGAGCHSARATAVTMLKELGYEDRDCAEFLRHSTTQMVQVYDKRGRGPSRNPGRSLEYRVPVDQQKSGGHAMVS